MKKAKLLSAVQLAEHRSAPQLDNFTVYKKLKSLVIRTGPKREVGVLSQRRLSEKSRTPKFLFIMNLSSKQVDHGVFHKMEVFHSVTQAQSPEVGQGLVCPLGAVIWPAWVSGLYVLHFARQQAWKDRSSEAT